MSKEKPDYPKDEIIRVSFSADKPDYARTERMLESLRQPLHPHAKEILRRRGYEVADP